MLIGVWRRDREGGLEGNSKKKRELGVGGTADRRGVETAAGGGSRPGLVGDTNPFTNKKRGTKERQKAGASVFQVNSWDCVQKTGSLGKDLFLVVSGRGGGGGRSVVLRRVPERIVRVRRYVIGQVGGFR